MNRFLQRADEWATAHGLGDELPPPHRFAPTKVDPRTSLELDLANRGDQHGALGDGLSARLLLAQDPRV